MIIDNIYYNNVAETEKTSFGYKLHRYPVMVEKHMNNTARLMSRYNCGCEIRFVTEAESVEVTLLAEYEGRPNVTVIKGDYIVSNHVLKPGEITTLRLSNPSMFKEELSDDFYKKNRFSKDVWRIWMNNGNFTICGVDAYGWEVRAPRPEEMPKKTLLAFGTSITHGAGANFHYSCYANQLAVKLGYDVLIKGLGGSCLCEKEAVDYIVKEDWDVVLLEPAVNMIGLGLEEFEKRISYLLKQMTKTGKPIFMTTIYPNSGFYQKDMKSHKESQDYDEVIRKLCGRYPEIHLIEGKDILTDTEYLSADGIHPCDYGHFNMAQNWYNKMKDEMKNV